MSTTELQSMNGEVASVGDIIATVVRQRLAPSIVNINVTPDHDDDGDKVLRITVVFDEDKGSLNSGRLVGLVRHVRSAISEQCDAFPLISFVSTREAAKDKLEAA